MDAQGKNLLPEILSKSLVRLRHEKKLASDRVKRQKISGDKQKDKELEESERKLEELSAVYERWQKVAEMIKQSLQNTTLVIQKFTESNRALSEYITAFCDRHYHAPGIPLHYFEYVREGPCCAGLTFEGISLYLSKSFDLVLEFDENHQIDRKTKIPTIPQDFSRIYIGKSYEECAFWHMTKWPDYLIEEIKTFIESLKQYERFQEVLSLADRRVNAPSSLSDIRRLHSCWVPPHYEV